MAGTKDGGKAAASTNKEKYGDDFYKVIGQKGGSKTGTTGGFASEQVGADGMTGRERASKVGALGGAKSKRSPGGLKGFELHYEADDDVDVQTRTQR